MHKYSTTKHLLPCAGCDLVQMSSDVSKVGGETGQCGLKHQVIGCSRRRIGKSSDTIQMVRESH
jgi:hypothetical protein